MNKKYDYSIYLHSFLSTEVIDAQTINFTLMKNKWKMKIKACRSEPNLFISREYFSSNHQLSAFDNDISDQLNIKFRLLSSGFSHLFI